MALIKDNNKQKKHKGENIIGKIIYGFLLFAPLLNILVTCMYVTFNKNAYQSYTQNVLQQNVKITTSSQLVEGVNYNISYKGSVTSTTLININYISLTKEQLNISQASYDTINSIAFYTNNGMEIRYNGGYAPYSWRKGTSFNIITTSNSGYNTLLSFAYVTQTTLVNDTLDNAFILGTQKTEQSNLFNWSKTTGTYTVLENTCNLLGITNTFTPMLLAYWLIISVIYFIYDIALILVWMVHKKIHELTDAI